ncbi:unnamed protein product [Closterium sp. NIES-54]
MHSCLLVSGLPRSLPPLPPSPAPPCLPCVEGRQRAAPHSSFPPTTAPLQTLHMDVWGPARVSGEDRECYFLLVVDDYTCYTTVFPLHSKVEVPNVLIPWIRAQNGLGEHRIGLVMEVARSSMIHVAAPHFLCPFAVQYAAHQLKHWPHVSLPETSPTLHWTGKVGNASMFRAWGFRAFVRVTSADNLSSHSIPCDVTFDESVPYYRLFPYCNALLDSGAARGTASGGAEPASAEPGGAKPEGAEPGGAEYEGAESGGAEPEGAERGGAEPEGAEPGGAESDGAESRGAEPRGTASA